jgi:hypothetical protein
LAACGTLQPSSVTSRTAETLNSREYLRRVIGNSFLQHHAEFQERPQNLGKVIVVCLVAINTSGSNAKTTFENVANSLSS